MKVVKSIKTKNNNEVQLFKAESHCVESLNKAKTILFIGVVHGDEPQGEELINRIIRSSELKDKDQLLFIPCLNPDGRDLKQRKNANGVDLNRNFPTKNWELSVEKDDYYSGSTAGSELETKFIIEVINEYKPDLIFTIHAPYKIVNYDGPAKEIAGKISELNNYPVQSDIGYPTPGSFGTYAGVERDIPTITLELPDNVDIDTLWEENKDAFFYIANY